jgi:hypothetical protein
MKQLHLEKKRTAVKQIVIVWLSLSILFPVIYLGFRKIQNYNAAIEDYRKIEDGISLTKTLVSDAQIDAAYKEAATRKKARLFKDLLAVLIFEIISLAGLAAFKQREGMFLRMETAIRDTREHARIRRELVALP